MRLQLKAFDERGERVVFGNGEGGKTVEHSTYEDVEDWEPKDVTDLSESSFDGTVFGLFAEDIALALANGAKRIIIIRDPEEEQPA